MEKFFKAASQEAVLLYNKETKIGVKIPFGTVACARHRLGIDEEREAMREKTTRMLEGLSKSPLVDCDKKRLLTNSIVRRYFQQVDAAQEAEYTLYFIDEEGNRISKSVVFAAGGNDGKAYATFELSSKNGFDKEKRYYLIIADGQGTPLAKLDYCIDISFANDFGF